MIPSVCHPERKHYIRGACEACYMREFRRNRPEYQAYMKAYLKQYRAMNGSALREKDRIRRKEQRQTPKGSRQLSRSARRSVLKRKFGLSEAEYVAMFLAQDNKCAICKKGISREVGKLTAVDHDHKTGIVRGLLCCGCNRGIGLIGDNPEILQSAVDYLLSAKKTDIMAKTDNNT